MPLLPIGDNSLAKTLTLVGDNIAPSTRVRAPIGFVAFGFAATLGISLAARAQQPAARPANHISLEQYLDWEDVQNPQLSPDGAQILFTRRWVDKMNDKWESSIWLMNSDGSHPRALAQGSDMKWSPDGKRIAYVAKGEPGGQQIFVRYMDSEGGTTQISHLTETPSALEWSPDGRTIAFNMNVPVRDTWHIAMPTPPKGAKWIDPPKVVTRLNYRSDRIGYTDDYFRHIFVIRADGGTARQISKGDWNYSAANFSADGKWLVYSGLFEPNAEMAYRKSNVYVANIETGATKQLTHRNGTSAQPLFSPDGRTIAFISADSGDHSAWAEGGLYMMNADGSNVHLVSGDLDRPITGVMWAPDNSGVYFNVESSGSKNMYFASTAGQFHPVTSGAQVLTVSDVGRNGLVVGVRSTPTKPNDVVSFKLPRSGTTSTFTQLTAVNDDILTGKDLAHTKRSGIHRKTDSRSRVG